MRADIWPPPPFSFLYWDRYLDWYWDKTGWIPLRSNRANHGPLATRYDWLVGQRRANNNKLSLGALSFVVVGCRRVIIIIIIFIIIADSVYCLPPLVKLFAAPVMTRRPLGTALPESESELDPESRQSVSAPRAHAVAIPNLGP